MNAEQFKHSFGERIVVSMDSGKLIEIMRFRKSGKPHRHGTHEIATCISGSGWIVCGKERTPCRPGETMTIPAGHLHHMEPDSNSDDPFEWIITYKD